MAQSGLSRPAAIAASPPPLRICVSISRYCIPACLLALAAASWGRQAILVSGVFTTPPVAAFRVVAHGSAFYHAAPSAADANPCLAVGNTKSTAMLAPPCALGGL